MQDVVSETSALLGGKLDHLIANAGIGGDHYMSTLTELFVFTCPMPPRDAYLNRG